jgi:ketosteroid isomerase-like protein
MDDKADIVRALFAAYLAADRQAVDAMLAADFRFTSPYDDEIDKATYFDRCWRGSDWIAKHTLERICVDGDTAFVTYQCVARDGKSFRNTEVLVFAGDKIRRIDVYFGATYQDGAFVRQSG